MQKSFIQVITNKAITEVFNMTYGYLRVSTDKQDENNQKVGVDKKAEIMGLQIDEYIIDYAVSGTVEPDKRKLGNLMNKLKSGDLIISSELSRLGRNMMMVMRILEFCMNNNVKVLTVKDNYELGNNIQSKVLAFAFSLAAEIERDMISRRIKEALARKKAEGITLGRKKGCKSANVKLTGKEDYIREMLSNDVSISAIGRILGVHRETVSRFIKEKIAGYENIFVPEMRLGNSPLLTGYENEIKKLAKKYSKQTIANMYRVDRKTIDSFMKKNNIICEVYSDRIYETPTMDKIANKSNEIIDMISKNYSDTKISDILGVDYQSLRKYLNKNRIVRPLRGKTEVVNL